MTTRRFTCRAYRGIWGVILLVAMLCVGCASDQNQPFDQARNQLHSISLDVIDLYNRGYDLSTIESVPHLIKAAEENGVGETKSEWLVVDYWGNNFQWRFIKIYNGITVYICSLGPPIGTSPVPHKEPFVRIQLQPGSEPSVQFFDFK
jgi:hypothetical protein